MMLRSLIVLAGWFVCACFQAACCTSADAIALRYGDAISAPKYTDLQYKQQ